MENTPLAHYDETIVSQDSDGNYAMESPYLVTVYDDLADVYFDMYEIAPIEDWTFTNAEFHRDILERIIVNNGE